MKYFYIVFSSNSENTSIFYREDPGPRYFADVMRVGTADNIAARLESIEGLLHANICSTKKEAQETAAAWNKAYKDNGTYIFR